MTLLFSDEIFQRHDTGDHPETSRRLASVASRLTASAVALAAPRGEVTAVATETLERVHDPALVRRVDALCAAGGGWIDADTVASPDSYRVALAAAGSAARAVDAVMEGRHDSALCLVRPPGHHATRDQAMGFCLFNSVAVAAQHAIDRHGAHRVLIVDWDVHHGNGTQDIFYDREDVFFYSIHRHPFYPGTGAADETGAGRGLGSTLNVPVAYGTSRARFLELFAAGLERAVEKARPDLILVSAGFDAHAADPVGNLGLATEDYRLMTDQLRAAARVHGGGRVVSCLEGGYNLSALAECVETHLAALAAGDGRSGS